MVVATRLEIVKGVWRKWMRREEMTMREYITMLVKEMHGIVHCKDCKYWDYEVDNDVGFCVRTEDCDWNADDFCSRGEKR